MMYLSDVQSPTCLQAVSINDDFCVNHFYEQIPSINPSSTGREKIIFKIFEISLPNILLLRINEIQKYE